MGNDQADFKIVVDTSGLDKLLPLLETVQEKVSEINSQWSTVSGGITGTGGKIEDLTLGGSGSGAKKEELTRDQKILRNLDEIIVKEKILQQPGNKEKLAELNTLKNAQKEHNDLMEVAIGKLIRYRVAFYAMAGAIQLLKNMMDITIEFQTTMANLQIVTNASTEDMQKMGDAVFNLGAKYGATISEVSEGMKVWAQAGYAVNDMLKLTEASLLASNVTGLSSAQATEALISAVETYGVAIGDVQNVVDKWMAVQAKYPVSAQDLANGMKMIGEQAQIVGVDINDLMGYITAINETTRKSGKAISMSLKSIFAGIVTDQGVKAFQDIGVAVYATENTFRDMDNVLDDLRNKWDTLTNVQKTNIALTIGGKHRYADFIALMNNYDKKIQATKVSEDAFGNAQKANASIMQTYQKQVTAMQVSWAKLGESTGAGVLIPLTMLVHSLKSLGDIFNLLPKWITGGIGAFGALTTGLIAIKTASWLATTGLAMVRTQTEKNILIMGEGALATGKFQRALSFLSLNSLSSLGIIAGIESLIYLYSQYRAGIEETKDRQEAWNKAFKEGTIGEQISVTKDNISVLMEKIENANKDLKHAQQSSLKIDGDSLAVQIAKNKINELNEKLKSFKELESMLIAKQKRETTGLPDTKFNKDFGKQADYYKDSIDLLLPDLIKLQNVFEGGLERINDNVSVFKDLGIEYDVVAEKIKFLTSQYDLFQNKLMELNETEKTLKDTRNELESKFSSDLIQDIMQASKGEKSGMTKEAFKTKIQSEYTQGKIQLPGLSLEQTVGVAEKLVETYQKLTDLGWQLDYVTVYYNKLLGTAKPLLKGNLGIQEDITQELIKIEKFYNIVTTETNSTYQQRLAILNVIGTNQENILQLEIDRNEEIITLIREKMTMEKELGKLSQDKIENYNKEIEGIKLQNKILEDQKSIQEALRNMQMIKSMSGAGIQGLMELPGFYGAKGDRNRRLRELNQQMAGAQSEYSSALSSGNQSDLINIKNQISDINYEMQSLNNTTTIWFDILGNISNVYIDKIKNDLQTTLSEIYGKITLDKEGGIFSKSTWESISKDTKKAFENILLMSGVVGGQAVGGGGKYAGLGGSIGTGIGALIGTPFGQTGIGGLLGGLLGGWIGGLSDTEAPLKDLSQAAKDAADKLKELSKSEKPIFQVRIGFEIGEGVDLNKIMNDPVTMRRFAERTDEEIRRIYQSSGNRR